MIVVSLGKNVMSMLHSYGGNIFSKGSLQEMLLSLLFTIALIPNYCILFLTIITLTFIENWFLHIECTPVMYFPLFVIMHKMYNYLDHLFIHFQ